MDNIAWERLEKKIDIMLSSISDIRVALTKLEGRQDASEKESAAMKAEQTEMKLQVQKHNSYIEKGLGIALVLILVWPFIQEWILKKLGLG